MYISRILALSRSSLQDLLCCISFQLVLHGLCNLGLGLLQQQLPVQTRAGKISAEMHTAGPLTRLPKLGLCLLNERLPVQAARRPQDAVLVLGVAVLQQGVGRRAAGWDAVQQ